MRKRNIYILLPLLVIFLQNASAQNSQVLYYMNLPQNHLLNPALRPSNSFYFGLPALTGMNINVNNNFFNFSDVIMPGQSSDSLITFLHPEYDINDFISKLKNRNFFAPEVNIQLLGLGFNAGKDMYIFLDVIDRVSGNIVIPGDLLKVGLTGNENFLGKTINLTVLDAELKYYREFGLGFSKNFGDKLRIGAKAKMLFGIASISLDNRSLSLTVNDDYTHTLNADLSANISGPVTVYMGTDNRPDSISIDENAIKSTDFFLNTRNPGFAFDIGAVYSLTDKITVSASITDLGLISWKSNVTNLKAESQFQFSGFNIDDVANGTKTFDELAQDMLDSLKESFTIIDGNRSFNTYLPVGISLGGSFNVTNSFSLGLLSHSTIAGKQLRQALTMSANVNLGNSFSTSLSYSMANSRFDNLGAGIAFRPGIFQFYLIADKIPVAWNKIITDNKSFPLPANWNTINFRFGMNLVFGNKIKTKKDKPMLMDQQQPQK
jgi:hypothetical protein